MTVVHGIDKVMANLNKEIKDIRTGTMKGFIKSAILVRGDMEKTSPKTPVDLGNLRSSWATSPRYINNNPALNMGYTANYAWFVHENVGANFKRPGAGAKWFEAALKRNQFKIVAIVRQEAGVK